MGRGPAILLPPLGLALLLVALPARGSAPRGSPPRPEPDPSAAARERAAAELAPLPTGGRRAPTAEVGSAPRAPADFSANEPAPRPLVLRVVHASSGSPAAGAAVEVAFSDEAGERRELRAADARGIVLLERSPAPLFAAAWTEDHAGGPVELDRAGRAATIALEPAFEVRGRVVDGETGAPISGATVRFWTFAELDSARTGADGRFVHPRFPAHEGGAQVRVEAPGHGAAVRYLEVESDGAWQLLASGADGRAESGRVAPAEIEVRLPRELRLTGRAVGPDGAPVAGARVAAEGYARVLPSVASPDRAESRTDEDGHFALAGLRADVGHALRVEAPALATLETEVPPGPGGERALGELALARESVLHVAVVDAAGTPALGVSVVLVPERGLEPAATAPLDPGARPGARRVARTDAAGNAVLDGLAAGRYELRARRDRGVLARAEVELAAGETRAGEVLVLPPEARVLRGVVVGDEGPVAGASVEVARFGPVARATTDASGAFAIAGLDDLAAYDLVASHGERRATASARPGDAPVLALGW